MKIKMQFVFLICIFLILCNKHSCETTIDTNSSESQIIVNALSNSSDRKAITWCLSSNSDQPPCYLKIYDGSTQVLNRSSWTTLDTWSNIQADVSSDGSFYIVYFTCKTTAPQNCLIYIIKYPSNSTTPTENTIDLSVASITSFKIAVLDNKLVIMLVYSDTLNYLVWNTTSNNLIKSPTSITSSYGSAYSVTSLSDAYFVATYTNSSPSGTLYNRIYDDDGTESTSSAVVVTTENSCTTSFSVISFTNQNYIVIYCDSTTMLGKRYNESGELVSSSAFTILGAKPSYYSAVAISSSIWKFAYSDSSNNRIYAKNFDISGTSLTDSHFATLNSSNTNQNVLINKSSSKEWIILYIRLINSNRNLIMSTKEDILPTCSTTQLDFKDGQSINFANLITNPIQDDTTTLQIKIYSVSDTNAITDSQNNAINVNNFYSSNEIYYKPTDNKTISIVYRSYNPVSKLESDSCTVTINNNCYASCKACTETGTVNDHKCSSCISNYYPLEDGLTKCYNTAITGYYFSQSESKYMKCSTSCVTCTGTSTSCTTCETGKYVDDSNQCTQCASNQTSDGVTCINCHFSCLTCSGTATNCLTCQISKYLDLTASPTCQNCNQSCKSCTSLNVCTTCNDGYLKFLNFCINPCPIGYFFDSPIRLCTKCSSNCKTCVYKNLCTECNFNYKLNMDNKLCYNLCPITYFDNGSNQCVKCGSNCDVCVNESTCSLCSFGYFAKDSQCYSSCPDNFYGNSRFRTCQQCPSLCKICLNDGVTCTECTGDNALFNKKCYQNCPSGRFKETINGIKQCSSCSSNCKVCDNTTKCTECRPYYFLHNDACQSTCPAEQYYPNTSSSIHTCSKCVDNCKFCSNGNTCVTCYSPYKNKEGTCVSDCGTGYYESNSN